VRPINLSERALRASDQRAARERLLADVYGQSGGAGDARRLSHLAEADRLDRLSVYLVRRSHRGLGVASSRV
jgi:hypothetical protein